MVITTRLGKGVMYRKIPTGIGTGLLFNTCLAAGSFGFFFHCVPFQGLWNVPVATALMAEVRSFYHFPAADCGQLFCTVYDSSGTFAYDSRNAHGGSAVASAKQLFHFPAADHALYGSVSGGSGRFRQFPGCIDLPESFRPLDCIHMLVYGKRSNPFLCRK